MNPELKAKWITALRSGEFKQGKGVLYNSADDTYCCYGVLRHVADPHDRRGNKTLERIQCIAFAIGPTYVLECMNDGLGEHCEEAKQWTFAEIADYIEKNL